MKYKKIIMKRHQWMWFKIIQHLKGQDLMMKMMMMIIKIIKNHLQRMRGKKYRKIIIIKRQEGKFKIIKLLKKGLERNQKRMESVKIKYKKKKKKKRWSPQNPKEDGVEKKIKKKKTKSNEIEDQWRILQTKNGTML